MSIVSDLSNSISKIVPVDERERDSISKTLDRLTWEGDLFDEEANDHHITASTFVVSERGVILHLHRKLQIWVQPGGHVDEGETPVEAALRETLEETGLNAIHCDPPNLFHVDVHPGPRGHTHYDLRYILLSPAVDPSPPPGESPEVYWFDFEAAQVRCEPALAPALGKLGRWFHAQNVSN
jgi:8-oxo-dGTP pyrophosphatase MutT (NUDIX family)